MAQSPCSNARASTSSDPDLPPIELEHAPHCAPAAVILRRLGLSPATPHLWLHVGPIGSPWSPCTMHGSGHPLGPPGRSMTVRSLAAFPGYYLDRLLVMTRPSRTLLPAARAFTVGPGLKGWLVYAAACLDRAGIWADWDAGGDAPALYQPQGQRSTTDDLRLFQRLENLIDEREARRGRQSHLGDPRRRDIVDRAEALKRETPRLPWSAIAFRLNLDVRTLRRYRNEEETERTRERGAVSPRRPVEVPRRYDAARQENRP